MTSSSFRYLVKHGLQSIRLNSLMSIASIGILTACLLLTGGAAMLTVSARSIFREIEGQNEMVIYISEDATEEQITALGDSIENLDQVDSYYFVSKEEAFAEQRESLGDNGSLLDGLEDDNPFPASYRVSLKDMSMMGEVSKLFENAEGVDSVSAPVYIADTLSGIERTIIIVGGIIVAIMLVAAVMVISNTIKLTVFARRKEIYIMKFVGATNRFIRLPFVVEGVSIGIISAVLAFGALWGAYYGISTMLVESTVPWISSISSSLVDFSTIWYYALAAFLVAGAFIGAVSSASSIRKHIQV